MNANAPPNLLSRPLPEGRKRNRRPVWEPPEFDYAILVDDGVHHKRREAVSKYYNGDAANTTKWLDVMEEHSILWEYFAWVKAELREAFEELDDQNVDFFQELKAEVFHDYRDVWEEFASLRVQIAWTNDGSCFAFNSGHLGKLPKTTGPDPSSSSSTPTRLAESQNGSQPFIEDWPPLDVAASTDMGTCLPPPDHPPTVTPSSSSLTKTTALFSTADPPNIMSYEPTTWPFPMMCGCLNIPAASRLGLQIRLQQPHAANTYNLHLPLLR